MQQLNSYHVDLRQLLGVGLYPVYRFSEQLLSHFRI